MSAHPPSILEPRAAAGRCLLLPIGGGYGELIPGLASALFAHSRSGCVKLAVIPASFSSNAILISAEERQHNLHAAACRRQALEAALAAEAPPGARCTVLLLPICTRADAEDPRHLTHFAELDAVFLLGGDQAVAMQVLADTPLEAALCDLHRRGGVIAGASAGAGMQARTMLAGYTDGCDAPHPLEYGIAALWDGAAGRGLACGQAGVVIDQHFFQRGRLPRLLEAIVRADAPHIGVGIDAYTGLHMRGGRGAAGWEANCLDTVFGRHAVAVLDAASLGAADTVRYGEPRQTVSVRDVLVHLLAPGPYCYDLDARRHSLAPLPAPRMRQPLMPPTGAGLLLLSGSTGEVAGSSALQRRFLAGAAASPSTAPGAAPGAPWRLLVVALDEDAERTAEQCARGLAESLALPANPAGGKPPARAAAVELVCGSAALAAHLRPAAPCAGIVVVGGSQGATLPAHLAMLAPIWRAGAALWLAGAATSAAGCRLGGSLPAINESDAQQTAQRRAPRREAAGVHPGLGLLPLTIEPRVLEECRWGRLFALAGACPDQPALALGAGVTLAIDASGAQVLGQGSLFALDLRTATVRQGDNEAYVVANGLLDAYAPGEWVAL